MWVKLTPRAGGQCQAPALDVVVADAASGRYHIKAAPAGDYCLIASDNRDPADITPSTPGWTPSAPADGTGCPSRSATRTCATATWACTEA
ncbi:hypothetical protein WJ970_12935 [Achromobacter xylosoxidans]